MNVQGSAARSLVGKRVKIIFDSDKQVASATVAADGQFSTTAPLPPARVRDGNKARYMAESGAQRSLDLKLTRRLEFGRIPLPGAVDDPTHQYSIAEVNLKAVMDAKNPEYNIPIRPHDVISVPHAEVVYVIGEVTRAGALPLSEGSSLSVLEAVSSSGGMLRTAAISHARILRPVAGQEKRAEVAVDLKKIMAGQSEDIPLLAGDVLVVPGSNGKHAVYRALEAAISAGTLVAVHY